MTDIKERLRKFANVFAEIGSDQATERDALAEIERLEAEVARLREDDGWLSIEGIPAELKDGRKVLVWHDHDSDPYHEPEPSERLTTYGAHCEGLWSEKEAGVYVAQFGGAYDEEEGYIPAWWFKAGDDWEHPLAPTHYRPLPNPPAKP